MKKVKKTAFAFAMVAALAMSATSCSDKDNDSGLDGTVLPDEPAAETPEQTKPTSRTIHVTVGAGLNDGAHSKATVVQDGTTRILKFTNDDKLYVEKEVQYNSKPEPMPVDEPGPEPEYAGDPGPEPTFEDFTELEPAYVDDPGSAPEPVSDPGAEPMLEGVPPTEVSDPGEAPTASCSEPGEMPSGEDATDEDIAAWNTANEEYNNCQSAYQSEYDEWAAADAAYQSYLSELEAWEQANASYESEHAAWEAACDDYAMYQTEYSQWENAVMEYEMYQTEYQAWLDAYTNAEMDFQTRHDEWDEANRAYIAYSEWERMRDEYDNYLYELEIWKNTSTDIIVCGTLTVSEISEDGLSAKFSGDITVLDNHEIGATFTLDGCSATLINESATVWNGQLFTDTYGLTTQSINDAIANKSIVEGIIDANNNVTLSTQSAFLNCNISGLEANTTYKVSLENIAVEAIDVTTDADGKMSFVIWHFSNTGTNLKISIGDDKFVNLGTKELKAKVYNVNRAAQDVTE